VLDAELPAQTQVRVASFSADQYRAPEEVQALPDTAWSAPLVNPPDALIGSPAGRYLWLRLELIGSPTHTPTVRSLRVDFPRLSYLRYLPAVYQEDARSREFLERFLALFETFFADLEDQIDRIVRYFDADAVTGDFLRWLASWLAIAADESWSEEQLRALLHRAPTLYKQRGTRAGIAAMLTLYTGDEPLLIEQFQLNCVAGGDPQLQALLYRLYGRDPYCFCVLLKPRAVTTESQRLAVQRLVEAEKPAHTCAGLLVLEPWVFLDMHTYLGVNTYLSQPSPRLDSGAAIPRDSVLTDLPEAGQIERRARLALDTRLT
jgi:phage tail-like protein